MRKGEPKLKSLALPNDLYGRTDQATTRVSASYIWLAYSVFFFIEPVMRNSRLYWLHQMPVYAIFLALYVIYVQVPRLDVAAWWLGCSSCWAWWIFRPNVGGSTFFVYVASLLRSAWRAQRSLPRSR